MIVSVTVGNHQEYPDHCPFQRIKGAMFICAHPDMESRQTLYCNYTHTINKYVEAPPRCLLLRHPVGGMRVEAVCR